MKNQRYIFIYSGKEIIFKYKTHVINRAAEFGPKIGRSRCRTTEIINLIVLIVSLVAPISLHLLYVIFHLILPIVMFLLRMIENEILKELL